MNRILRIGYATTGAASDINNWSGLVFNIRQALADQGHHIQPIDNLIRQTPWITRIRGWAMRFLMRKTYAYDRDISLARRLSYEVQKKLALFDLDCVVAPSSLPLSMLETDLPMACWGDATFHALRELYPGFKELAGISIRMGDFLERRSISKCGMLAYSSQWAAQDAVEYYHADPSKVHVVPFGANCSPQFSCESAARNAISKRTPEPLRLLFVGADWERKGGPLALKVLQELHHRHVAAELWVAGCDPFQGNTPLGVRCLGFLSKSDPQQRLEWSNCFASCHVFLLPSRAECFGVVFAEAATYALPSLASLTGGVFDAVREGENGHVFPLDADAIPYADLLEHWVQNWETYQQAALRAWKCSEAVLNWQSSGKKFSDLLIELVESNPTIL